jgi:hypothetical protein
MAYTFNISHMAIMNRLSQALSEKSRAMASPNATGTILSCSAKSLTISKYCSLNGRLASLLPIVGSKVPGS